MNCNVFFFYQDLFSKKSNAEKKDQDSFLENLKKKKKYGGVLSEKETFESMKSFQNNKSPGNDGLQKSFAI